MPIDALYNAIRNAPNQQGWQAAQQREAASHQAAIDEAVAREQAAQQAQQLWNGYDYNAEAERRAQVGGYTPAPEAFRAPTPTNEYDPSRQAQIMAQAWQPQTGVETSYNNKAAYIPGTQIPYDTERGQQYLALEAQRDAARKAFEPFRTIPGANDAAANIVRDIDTREGTLKEYLSDDEYRADVAAQRRAAETYQRQQTMSETDAGNQLAELYRQRDELQKLIGSTSSAFRDSQGQALNSARQEQLARINAQIRQYETDINAVAQSRTIGNYDALAGNADFAELSQYVPSEKREAAPVEKAFGLKDGYNTADIIYELVNGNADAWLEYQRDFQSVPLSGMFDDTNALKQIGDKERAIYNYLYHTDTEQADRYLEDLAPTLNARARAEQTEWAQKLAREHPVQASLLTTALSPLKGLGLVMQGADYVNSGKIDENAAYNTLSRVSSTIRTQVSRDIERNYGKPGSFAYQTGMSVADNLYQMLLTGGAAGEGVMLAIMGSGAAADSILAAKQRGLSDGQAFALGLASGAIEAITEKIGLDALYEGIRGGKTALRAILNSTLAEGSEEVLGTFLDDIADMIIAGTDSERLQRIAQLKAQGMSDSEAAGRAYVELLKEAGVAGLSGALSGLLMSGGAQAIINGYHSAQEGIQTARDAREQNRVDEMVRMANEEAAQRYANLFKPQQTAQTEQTAAVPSEPPANPAVSAPTAPQTATDTATQTAQETPIQNGETTAAALDPNEGEYNGWGYYINDNGDGTWDGIITDSASGGSVRIEGDYATTPDPRAAVVNRVNEQALGNTVGAAETGFNYTEFPHEQKVSAQAETTMRYDPTRGRAAGQSQRAWRQALTYTTQSDAEVNAKADEALNYADSYEGGVEDLMDDLRYTPGLWNAVESVTARRIGTRLEQESLNARRAANDAKRTFGAKSPEYKAALEASKDAQAAVRDWNKLMQDDARGVARAMQIRTQWSGRGNEDGSRTERAAVRAIENNDNISNAQKTELTETVQNYMDDVRLVDEDVKDGSISEDEGKQNLIDIIVEVGRRRGTLANGVITRLVTANLSTLTFEELKQAAFAESGMLAFDKTAADPWQIVKTVQVLNMLSNPKTFATNVLSNTAFRGIDKLAMRGAALMDALLEKATGTRSVAWEDAVSRRIWDEVRHAAAKSIVEIALDIDMGGEGKYSPTGTQNFRAQGGEAALPVRAMRIWERNNNFALVLPDEIAKAHTRGSVSRSMEKLTQEGRIRSKDKNYAQTYANNLAEYRTFQNTRLASDITKGLHDAFNLISLSTIQQRNAAAERGEKLKFKDIDPAKFGLGDLIAPFSKIGGNLVGVALDYSPVKFLTGIAQTIELLAQQHRANVNNTEGVSAEQQARAVSNLGRGFTGTALSLGLYVLAKAGLIRRGKEEDPTLTSQQKSAVNSLNKAEGRTGTQINMSALGRWLSGKGGDWQEGDRLYDLSRFEPFNFFIDYALMLADNWDEADDFVSYVSGATQAVLDTMGNNVSDMPVFQSLSNFNNARSYGDKWYQAAISSLGKTAASSSTPNILAAFAKGMDDKQRDLYTHQAEGTDLLDILAASALETFDYAKSRIPFLRETLPTKVGTDGKPLTNPGNTAQRLLNAMLNPLGTNTLQQSEASAELERIRNATGDASFYPKVRSSAKSLEYTENGEKHTIPLDYEQRQAFQEAYSTAYWDVANAMVKLPEFKRLAPEEQAKALGKLEKYAYQKAKQPYVGDKHIDKWVRTASKNTTSLARWLVANR